MSVISAVFEVLVIFSELDECKDAIAELSEDPAWLGFRFSVLRQVQSVATGDVLTKRARGSLSPPSRPGKAVARARRAFMQGDV